MASEQEERTRLDEREHLEQCIDQVKSFLGPDKKQQLEQFLHDTEPEDIAEILRAFTEEEKQSIFGLLDLDYAAVVLDDTDPQSRLQLLQKIDSRRLTSILGKMPVDEAADVIEDIPEKERHDILELMKYKDAREVAEILSYPEDSAARVMNPEFVSVNTTSSVEDAIIHIRSLEVGEQLFYVYVVDDHMKLKGVVPIRKLLTVPKGTLIREIMDEDVHSVYVDEDQERTALVMKKYDLSALPVIDEKERLVGRITVDDIIDVMDQERGEDISSMIGTIEEEQGTETLGRATRNRLPWLVTCMLGSILTGLVIQMFEGTLAETIALVSFIPVITATGGNSGVQASTVVVREIALGHMDLSKVAEELWRQFKIALGLGVICGVLLSVIANFWKGNTQVGLIVGVSLFLIVIWSNAVGVFIPVFFKHVKVDPALASGPFITTLNDVTGVFIYLSVAAYFMV